MAKLLTNAGVTEIIPANGNDFKLKELYDILVTDMVQVIDVGIGQIMILDEEGKCKDKAVNYPATRLARGYIHESDCIVGTAIVCDSAQLK